MASNGNGYISLHRSIQKHWIYEEKRKFSKYEAWLDLLMMVNYKDNKTLQDGQLVEVKRGERITSIRQLMDRWDWSNTKVVNFLNLLSQDEMITFEITPKKKTLIKIVKYEQYQGFEVVDQSEEKTQERQSKDSETTQNNINNKENKENKDNKENIPYSEIIDYLNLKANKKFKNVESNKKLIRARWAEGQRLEDFEKVIDNMVINWQGKTFTNGQKGDNYLQPSTLFGNKFEGYRNQVPNGQAKKQSGFLENFNEPEGSFIDGPKSNGEYHPINNDILPKR